MDFKALPMSPHSHIPSLLFSLTCPCPLPCTFNPSLFPLKPQPCSIHSHTIPPLPYLSFPLSIQFLLFLWLIITPLFPLLQPHTRPKCSNSYLMDYFFCEFNMVSPTKYQLLGELYTLVKICSINLHVSCPWFRQWFRDWVWGLPMRAHRPISLWEIIVRSTWRKIILMYNFCFCSPAFAIPSTTLSEAIHMHMKWLWKWSYFSNSPYSQ